MDDTRTMAEVAGGSEEALAAVYSRLASAVRSVGRRIVGPSGADDVVQETFERLWRHADRFDARKGSLEAWTMRIARNVAVGQLRRTRPNLELLPGAEPPDPGAGPADAVVLIDLSDGVRRAVAGLPETRRTAVEHVLAGHTMIQTAGRLNLPEGTLKSRVRAAYAELRTSLAYLQTA